METCPHCGVRLPPVVHAYCPDSFAPLDEQPIGPGPSSRTDTRSVAARSGTQVGLLLMLAGIAGLFATVLSATRGNRPDALYTGGGSLTLVVIGSWISGGSTR